MSAIGSAAGKTAKTPSPKNPPKPAPTNSTTSQNSSGSGASSSKGNSESKSAGWFQASKDKVDLSSEATAAKTAPPRSEEEKRLSHLQALEQNYSVFDNPDGEDRDGITGLGDIETIAKGELNEDETKERLRQQGVAEDQLDERLQSIKDTASFLMADEEFRKSLDTANDNEGDPDGKIGRGDLDRSILNTEQSVREQKLANDEQTASEEPTEQEVREVQEAVERWSAPGEFERDLQERPLSEMSSAELDALVALNEKSPEAQGQIEQAVLRSVNSSEALDKLPQGDAYNYLLDKYVTGREVPEDVENREDDPTVRAQEHLGGLVENTVNGSLDQHLEGRSGDEDLALAQERVSSDLQGQVMDNPALVKMFEKQTETSFGEYSDKFTEVARRDDNIFQQTNHALTGASQDFVGTLTDKYRDVVHDFTEKASDVAKRGLGFVDSGFDLAGRVGEAGLDFVGAEGVGDNFRNTADQAGDVVEQNGSVVADQAKNFSRGLHESVAGTAEGLNFIGTNPLGAAQGVVEAVKDPSLLLEGYKETLNEHGAAGLAGNITGDLALSLVSGGTGAAAKGLSVAGRLGRITTGNRGGSLTPTGLAERVAKSNPELAAKIADFRPSAKASEAIGRRVHRDGAAPRQALENLKEKLGSGKEPVTPAMVDELLADGDFSKVLDDIDNGAKDIDFPEGYRVLASGRADVLRELAKQKDGISKDKFASLAADLLDTGSLKHKAYLVDLPEGASVGRRYSSDGELRDSLGLSRAIENGGYWTVGDDVVKGSARRARIRSALPSFNKADRSKVGQLKNNQAAVLTQIAPMYKFGLHAWGGDLQLQPTAYLNLANEIRRTHTSPHLYDYAAPLPVTTYQEEAE
jgi:hypothetical protein